MIYLLSGEIGSGKSSALKNWSVNRDDVHGILSLRSNENKKYFLTIDTEEKFSMHGTTEAENNIKVGSFSFSNKAFQKAIYVLQKNIDSIESGFIVIDELGKLELESKGLHNAVCSAIQKTRYHKKLHSILVVRSSLVKKIIKKYELTNAEHLSKEYLLQW